ncbi:hypothetical protein PGB90_002129 [Kerria lacca]
MTSVQKSAYGLLEGTYEMSQESESPLGQWNHGLSSMLACLGCTLGIFNISRFAIFSIHFGANFIFQFLVLTLLIGIPLFTFHISLGQLLGTGVLNMWHISPIFKGIGVALLLSQAFIGVYSIIGVSWMFVYFRDSFISKQDVYRWAEPLELYGEDGVRTLKYSNGSYKIEQTVPDYFGGVVLQRRNVLKQEEDLMNVKFSVAFNLAIVWIIVFLSLSKGLKSYGKVVYVFSILPIFGMTLLCAKLLGFLPSTSKGRSFFPETDWSEFFLNSKSWIAAFTEVFLTWGVFGASAMQIASHNRQKHFLYRDSALVIIITISVLLLSAFIANMCSQLLEYNNFLYLPSSFERSTTYIFLQRMDIPLPYSYATTPIRWMLHSGLILGERTIKPGMNMYQESGYQPLRLATELVPATFAAIGPKLISPFWSVLFYFIFIMFGIAQQMAIWYGVISNLLTINIKALKPCWTTITWFTCIAGFILGLPMTTETGIFVVYFLDFVIGCGWWIMVLYLLQLGAIFIVRGRPYSSETIVITLFTRSNYFLQNWIAPMFSFNWNVILPVTLLLLSTSVFKNGGYRMLYNWHSPKFYEYWPPWSRKFGCLLQIMPLFTIPLVGIIQSYLYLTDGPLDLFERIQMLYRPVMENSSDLRNPNLNDVESNNRNNNNNGTNVTTNDDPPPKYTPPPSYSTATGTRIAKLLRQSFRRSMVRIAHVLGTSDSIPSTSNDQQTLPRQLPPPPDYSTVLVEINQCRRGIISVGNSSSIIGNETQCSNEQPPSSPLTAEDVANILRSSLRRNRTLPLHCNSSNNLVEQECTSIQCLVESAAPINQDSIVVLDDTKTEEQST